MSTSQRLHQADPQYLDTLRGGCLSGSPGFRTFTVDTLFSEVFPTASYLTAQATQDLRAMVDQHGISAWPEIPQDRNAHVRLCLKDGDFDKLASMFTHPNPEHDQDVHLIHEVWEGGSGVPIDGLSPAPEVPPAKRTPTRRTPAHPDLTENHPSSAGQPLDVRDAAIHLGVDRDVLRDRGLRRLTQAEVDELKESPPLWLVTAREHRQHRHRMTFSARLGVSVAAVVDWGITNHAHVDAILHDQPERWADEHRRHHEGLSPRESDMSVARLLGIDVRAVRRFDVTPERARSFLSDPPSWLGPAREQWSLSQGRR